MIVEEAVSEIRKGDFLLKMDGETGAFSNHAARADATHRRCKVISILDGVHEAGTIPNRYPEQRFRRRLGQRHGLEHLQTRPK